jgi:hypothetical protein
MIEKNLNYVNGLRDEIETKRELVRQLKMGRNLIGFSRSMYINRGGLCMELPSVVRRQGWVDRVLHQKIELETFGI